MTTIDNAPRLANAPDEELEESRSSIEIDGASYEIPRLDELDLDEEQILYDVANVAVPDFMPAHPDSPREVQNAIELVNANRTRNPAFKRALVIIAYRRKHPDLDAEQIGAMVGKIGAFDAELALYGKARAAAEEDAAEPDPPSSSASDA